MAKEIERKFLVKGEFRSHANKSVQIIQGYLSSVPERAVRIRIKGDKGFITVKGIGNKSGLSRYEWEKEIRLKDARDLLKICEEGVIEKTRYLVHEGQHTFEVDVFSGINDGLVIAEIELKSEDEKFTKPKWLGKEVSGEEKYYNAMLMKNPYQNWD